MALHTLQLSYTYHINMLHALLTRTFSNSLTSVTYYKLETFYQLQFKQPLENTEHRTALRNPSRITTDAIISYVDAKKQLPVLQI